GAGDVSLVDTLRLRYAHSFAADENALVLSVNNGSARRITGFTSNNIRVVDITRPDDVLEITQTARVNSETDGTYSVDVQVARATFRQVHKLLVFVDNSGLSPDAVEQNQPSTWASQTA